MIDMSISLVVFVNLMTSSGKKNPPPMPVIEVLIALSYNTSLYYYQVTMLTADLIKFTIFNANQAIANALRRIMIAEVVMYTKPSSSSFIIIITKPRYRH